MSGKNSKPGKILPALHGDSLKAEEIAFLEIVRGQIADSVYLCDFLSDPMMGWLKMRISGDMPCDLWAQMIWDESQAQKRHAARERELEAEIEGQKALIREQRELNRVMLQSNEQQGTRLEYWKDLANSHWTRIHAQEREIYASQQERDRLQTALDEAEAEVARLKAKLFDLAETKGIL